MCILYMFPILVKCRITLDFNDLRCCGVTRRSQYLGTYLVMPLPPSLSSSSRWMNSLLLLLLVSLATRGTLADGDERIIGGTAVAGSER